MKLAKFDRFHFEIIQLAAVKSLMLNYSWANNNNGKIIISTIIMMKIKYLKEIAYKSILKDNSSEKILKILKVKTH